MRLRLSHSSNHHNHRTPYAMTRSTMNMSNLIREVREDSDCFETEKMNCGRDGDDERCQFRWRKRSHVLYTDCIHRHRCHTTSTRQHTNCCFCLFCSVDIFNLSSTCYLRVYSSVSLRLCHSVSLFASHLLASLFFRFIFCIFFHASYMSTRLSCTVHTSRDGNQREKESGR